MAKLPSITTNFSDTTKTETTEMSSKPAKRITKHKPSSISDSLSEVISSNKADKDRKEQEESALSQYEVCAIDPNVRSHFVLHCTAGNMTLDQIKKHTNYNGPGERLRYLAHVYLMKDGTTVQIWPFSEKNVRATKMETEKKLIGRMFHVEINYRKPDVPTEEQYQGLADLYIEAANVQKCWPIIVPHIEIDRGIKDGHADPTDFDYNHFYGILEEKGVPIATIPKFDHDRYWGKPNYKTPWGTDKISWPPILTGNPHKS